MTFTTDAVRTKTDAELQFFVDNPSQHHPDLLEAARRELHRREVPLIGPGSIAYYPANELHSPPSKRPLLLAAAVLGLGLAGAGFWLTTRPPAPAPPKANNLSAEALKLESVETQRLPTFDTDALVADQVARIPAAEKQDAQALRQFRELGQRFWTAETQTEYLTNQADKGKAGPFFTDQALLVRETWRAWNKAIVYSYRFGPKMQGQLALMRQAASSQQHILANLPALLPNRAFATDKELVARGTDVQDWLAGIRRVSPVTGKAYKATVLEIKL
ncbi:hypothetical protein QMK33_17210 [Hymenobacter sp. H14-R3]|uniref:hypothetical protein n=1 Tax=Hymenobacter sp. H14-R3 TaxID=3046308 RepID=UPI0024B9F9EC|nr:hypothetical protein [Hymenobacter sp. H14-R3]MDJ0366893.1 hypothetical protein [Hymenobacter sp. H14-R3]